VKYGEYLVTGSRRYRDHEPGITFEARLDRNAEARAVQRGDIRLLRLITPTVEHQPRDFPQGWLKQPSTAHEATEGG
jgi:hypothetical protein